MRERLECAVEGCKKKGRNKGLYKGKTRYDRYCEAHHRMRMKYDKGIWQGKFTIPNDKCENCGWDKAPCDRHRIDPSKGYYRENVKVLCPNCHRLEHHGIERV